MTITALLARGVAEIIVAEDLEKELASGRKLRVKLGIDPTAPDLHLGHTVPLRKLRQFQDAGHQAVLIIGDTTAMIGDPSGRPGAREPLTHEQVKKNLAAFIYQAGKVLDMASVEVRYNSEWLGKIALPEWLAIQAKCTVAQIIDRSDFKARLEGGMPVGLHELSYPVLQAYDSVMVRADVELGGLDQRLNLIAGRELMEKMGMAPQQIMMMPLLVGTDGVKKMSKSMGNYIGLAEAPNEMFGKLMAIPDALMPNYFALLTDGDMPNNVSPRDAKSVLAKTIVGMYHGAEAGERAEEYFIKIFSKKEMPEDMPELQGITSQSSILEALRVSGVSSSNTAARELIRQGGVKLDGKIIDDPNMLVGDSDVLQSGKHTFFRIKKDTD